MVAARRLANTDNGACCDPRCLAMTTDMGLTSNTEARNGDRDLFFVEQITIRGLLYLLKSTAYERTREFKERSISDILCSSRLLPMLVQLMRNNYKSNRITTVISRSNKPSAWLQCLFFLRFRIIKAVCM